MQLVIRGRETPALRRTNVAILSTVVRAVCAVIVLGDYDTVGINRVWGMFPNAIDDGVISSEGDAIAGSHVDYVRIPVDPGHPFHAIPDTIPLHPGHRYARCRTPFRYDAGHFRPSERNRIGQAV